MDAFMALTRDRRGSLRHRLRLGGVGRFLVGGVLLAMALSTAGIFTGCNSVDSASTFGPAVTGITPASGPPGTEITITGTSFGPMFGGVTFTDRNKTVVTAPLIAWKDTEVIAQVPAMPTGVQTSAVNVLSSAFAPAMNPVSFRVTKAE